ncbi:Pre-mRNA-splicing factor ATP-dependent RNA helicase PRP16 [Pyrenophora tritici-repentis]|nr:Pre-mRNA-splicing factor ATP-dependent RNA helicase PRP16 [Pyrenophora tritici-repentis]
MPKFVPRQRKHKVLARRKPSNDGATIDANAAEILPQEEQERAQKKAALKDELTRESQGKMSGKKKKRLDKYIDTKLKKEENLELLKKLASQKIDTSLFQSSKKLGRGGDTKREALRRALAESRAGIDVAKNEGLLLEKHEVREMEENSSDEDSRPTTKTGLKATPAKASSKPAPNEPLRERSPSPSPSEPETHTSATPLAGPQWTNGLFGTGLKRPLES